MSAFRGYMCTLRRFHRFKTPVACIRQFGNRALSSNKFILLDRAVIPAHSNFICFYSSKKTGSGSSVKGLTDEILQSKLTEHIETAKDSDKSQGSEKSENKDAKPSRFSNWTGKNAWKLGITFLGGYLVLAGSALLIYWGAPPEDPEGKVLEDEFSHLPTMQAYIKRTMKEFSLFTQKIQDPSREKLLPDPVQYPYYQPPYTLVIEMTGILVHPDWTYSTGWRFKKRKGIEYFLQKVGPPLFEVVIFTSELGYTADPILNTLDPHGYIMHRLYRDGTKYVNGHHLKDLSCLNRDLSKVIMLDWNQKSVELQRSNALIVNKWSGDDDTTLYDLANFLNTLGSSEISDVRTVLDYYNQFEDPVQAFKDNQKRLQEEQEKQAQQLQAIEKSKSANRLNFLPSWRR